MSSTTKTFSLEELTSSIEQKGYSVYKVGGAVRDEILNIPSTDIDLTTSMPIKQLIALCEEKGYSYAVALERAETKVLIIEGFEVAEFRKDIYSDDLQFQEAQTGTIVEDANRRDFTINALYKNSKGIIDLVNGLEDIQNKTIRTCGEPIQRFQEDASRIIRAAYLAAKLNFTIHEDIIRCVHNNKNLINNIHPSLMGKMIVKAIKAKAFHAFLEKLEELDIVFDVFPEWKQQYKLIQNPTYHHLDVWEHTKLVVKHAEQRHPQNVAYILSAFCHDVAKGLPDIRIFRNGQPSDLGHEEAGAKIAYKFIIRLELGKPIAQYVQNMTEFHGKRPSTKERSLRKFIREVATSQKDKESLAEFLSDLFDLMYDDCYSFSPTFSEKQAENLKELRAAYPEVLEKYPYYKKDLPIDGRYILENTGLRGVHINDFLQSALDEGIYDKEHLLRRLKNANCNKPYL